MLTAITRAVSPALADCELSFIERVPIDMERAREQHHAYENALTSLGAKRNLLTARTGTFRFDVCRRSGDCAR